MLGPGLLLFSAVSDTVSVGEADIAAELGSESTPLDMSSPEEVCMGSCMYFCVHVLFNLTTCKLTDGLC